MALQRGPIVEAQLARDQVLGFRQLRRRFESGKRLGLAGARGLEQVPGAFALLFEIETKLRIGSERVGHDRVPYRRPAFAQADKGEDRPSRSGLLSWAQPFPRTWMLRPSADMLDHSARKRQAKSGRERGRRSAGKRRQDAAAEIAPFFISRLLAWNNLGRGLLLFLAYQCWPVSQSTKKTMGGLQCTFEAFRVSVSFRPRPCSPALPCSRRRRNRPT